MQRINILKQIRDLQTKSDALYFKEGLFPSYRKNTMLGLFRADDNIFFSVSVLFVLQSLSTKLTIEERSIVAEIQCDLLPNISSYTNKPERNSYNFWKKKKGKHFPNGSVLHSLGKFQLPDDIDTTSMVQMVSGTTKEDALVTKKVLPNYANEAKKTIKNGHQVLRGFKAYSTWFGENMPIEFDVCVLSNYLLWVNHYNFELNQQDEETILLIKKTIEQSLYFQSSFKSAPEYPKSHIILYHLARLASEARYIEDSKNKLTADIKKLLAKTERPFEKMLLQSSLLKLGEDNPDGSYLPTPHTKQYWWFTAGLLSVYSIPVIKSLATLPLFHFRFICEAFNLTLLFENMVLNQKH